MKKIIKTLSILVISAILTVCVALFAACGDDNKTELATDKVYITVLDENGNAINGTTFGEGDYDNTVHQVKIQFCTVDGDYGCSLSNPNVDENGKAEFNLSELKELTKNYNATTIELHVLNVTAVGYAKEYNQYKISEVPKNITVTLKKA